MAFKQSSTSGFGGSTAGFDPVLTVPSQTLEGDLMVVVVQTSDNNPDISPTAPGGWTLFSAGSMPVDGTAATSPSAVWIYSKDASAADEAGAGTDTYTWTFSGSEEQVGIAVPRSHEGIQLADGGPRHGPIEFDESARSTGVALYVQVVDPQTGKKIGLAKAIVDLNMVKKEI